MDPATHGRGFVLSRRERGESDLLVDLLLDDGRVVHAVAKGGGRSSRRFSSGLAAFTRYRFVFGRGLTASTTTRLEEASVDQAFPGVLRELRRTAAAGAAAVVARELGGEVTMDAGLFDLYDALVADLEACEPSASGTALMRFVHAAFEHAGHPLVLDACVRCGRDAPANARVTVNPLAGGVVCGACGGGPMMLRADRRRALRRVFDGESDAFDRGMLAILAELIGTHAPRGAEALASGAAHWPARA